MPRPMGGASKSCLREREEPPGTGQHAGAMEQSRDANFTASRRGARGSAQAGELSEIAGESSTLRVMLQIREFSSISPSHDTNLVA